jgi:hypothetical protein
LPSSRRKAISEEEQKLITERSDAKQKLLSERQTKHVEGLALKHDLQQQEQIGHGSDMKGLKNKVTTVGNANRQCSSCGIYVSDKLEHGGTQRCRGARHTVAKFNGQCCSCRFDLSTMY